MAVRSRAGTSASTAFLVIFVLLTAIAGTLAVLFYAKGATARAEAARAQEDLAAFVTPQESRLSEVQAIKPNAGARGGETVVGTLLKERSDLRALITAVPDQSVAQIIEDIEAEGLDPANPMFTSIRDLTTDMKAKQAELEGLQAEVARLRKQVADSQKQIAGLTDSTDEQVAGLRDRVQDIDEENEEHFDETETAIGAIETDYKQQLENKRAELRELHAQVAAQNEEISKLKVQLDVLNDKFRRLGRVSAPDMTKLVDGRIVSVVPKENLVYINLGRRDKIFLGMTFEVFDPARGVVVDEKGEQRGKASIEVVDVTKTSAACRVVRERPGRPVLANDLISNVAYDRDMEFKFVVHGEFDLNYDGLTSITDRERVESLIKEWGGVVTDELALDTDFLVVGLAPPLPKQLTAEHERDPILLAEALRIRQAWDDYQKIGGKAQDFSVPVLNQNRFLVLIGYFNR